MSTDLSTPKALGVGCLGLVMLIAGLTAWLTFSTESSEKEATPLIALLDSKDAMIYVANHEAVDWTNCELAINAFSQRVGGYRVRLRLLRAGEQGTISAGRFTTSDGTRFNPITTAANTFHIACDTPTGRRYAFYGPR